MSPNTTITSYNTTAQEYAEKTKDFTMEQETSEFLPLIQKGGLILDIGCGPGRDAKRFTKKGYDVIGIDPSTEMINVAKREAPLAIFQNAYAENLPFKNKTFDGIWACASLIHLPKQNLPTALVEAYRVLKPNTAFYLDFKQGSGEKLIEDKRYGNVKKFFSYYQESEIERMLKSTGFSKLKTWEKGINNPYATNTWMKFLAKKN